jgi:bifunctional NMN adenylyltransferase/nudix hydrolase
VRGNELLLGRKANEDLFRFIGGFTDPTDDCYEDAAKREASEETGLEIGQPRYIGSKKIDDWRYRNEADKIITHLFVADYVFGNPKAQDDIAELRWFDVDKITPAMVVAPHKVLLEMFLGMVNR